MLKNRLTTIAIRPQVMTAMELDIKERHTTLYERVDDIADWYNRIRGLQADYHLGEITINTLMQCVNDLIVITRYYRQLANTKGSCEDEAEGER